MDMHLKPILIFTLIIALCSCTLPSEDKLLFSIQKRNISADRITEHRFYSSGLTQTTIIHDSNKAENLFQTKFSKLEPETKLLTKLQELDYHNHFPWKQDFYKRGDVIKVQFPKLIETQVLAADKQVSKVLVNKTYYFYSGDDDAPSILSELLELIH